MLSLDGGSLSLHPLTLERFFPEAKYKAIKIEQLDRWQRHSLWVDWNDGQFFVAMEWWWSYFPNDGMAMVFENFSPSPSMVFGGINHQQRWFFDGFSIFGDQWLTMVTEGKNTYFVTNSNSRQIYIYQYLPILLLLPTFTHHIMFQVCNPKTC